MTEFQKYQQSIALALNFIDFCEILQSAKYIEFNYVYEYIFYICITEKTFVAAARVTCLKKHFSQLIW